MSVRTTKYQGEFEERLKNVLKDLAKDQGQTIVFIDKLHTQEQDRKQRRSAQRRLQRSQKHSCSRLLYKAYSPIYRGFCPTQSVKTPHQPASRRPTLP
ncbi:MAG: AAA family ATPase [Rhodoferax sp.]|nr:AAA family ATPase [Rhodoferax sp.]